jgi:IS30 family transposase
LLPWHPGHLGGAKNLYTAIQTARHKTAETIRAAVNKAFTPHRNQAHTIAYDNGREFTDHEGMASDLDSKIHFAHPYVSCEHGVNENINDHIRLFFPKGRGLATVTHEEIEQAMNLLNRQPRKSMGFRTPHEALFSTKPSLIVALQS